MFSVSAARVTRFPDFCHNEGYSRHVSLACETIHRMQKEKKKKKKKEKRERNKYVDSRAIVYKDKLPYIARQLFVIVELQSELHLP